VALLRDLPPWLFALLTLVFFVGVDCRPGLGEALSRGRGLHALVDNSAVG
jgi:hypothetical protein